jgi:hypothetical protein
MKTNIFGQDNIVVNGDGNTVIKEAIMKQKGISDDNLLVNIVNEVIRTNHEILYGQNPNCIYLAGFTRQHLDTIEKHITHGLVCENKKIEAIDMIDKTKTFMIDQLSSGWGTIPERTTAFYRSLIEKERILIIKGLSASRIPYKVNTFRGIIKTLDDAHLKDEYPKTDIIFIDYAAFLEKNYSQIGPYLSTNVIGIGFFA